MIRKWLCINTMERLGFYKLWRVDCTNSEQEVKTSADFMERAMADKPKPIKQGEKKAGIQKPAKKAHVLPLLRTLTRIR
jgi:hypothetical protein